jgi:ribosomal protein S18 acetylase RimI-like enzyme
MAPDPAAVHDASAAMFARINMQVPGLHGLIEDDVVLAAMGLPFARVNWAGAAHFRPDNADARIDAVAAWFDERDLPFVWRLGPADQPSDLQERLLAKDFALDPDDMPGMVAPLANLPEVTLPDGASLEVVRDPQSFRQQIAVMVEAFGMPAQIGDAFLPFADLGFTDDLPTRSFLVRIDGRAVATALAVFVGDGVVISNVATLPEARNRGFGRAVTLAAMHAGAEMGARIAVLQSSEMGLNVYRRLGFEEFGRYKVFARLRD